MSKKEPKKILPAEMLAAENLAYAQAGWIHPAVESAIRADERAKVDAEVERLRAELSAIDGVAKQIVETMAEGSNAVIKPLREEIERLKSENIRLREALKGVIRIADRDCPEFRAAHAALEEEEK